MAGDAQERPGDGRQETSHSQQGAEGVTLVSGGDWRVARGRGAPVAAGVGWRARRVHWASGLKSVHSRPVRIIYRNLDPTDSDTRHTRVRPTNKHALRTHTLYTCAGMGSR